MGAHRARDQSLPGGRMRTMIFQTLRLCNVSDAHMLCQRRVAQSLGSLNRLSAAAGRLSSPLLVRPSRKPRNFVSGKKCHARTRPEWGASAYRAKPKLQVGQGEGKASL